MGALEIKLKSNLESADLLAELFSLMCVLESDVTRRLHDSGKMFKMFKVQTKH